MSPRLPDGRPIRAVTLDAFGTLFDFEAVLADVCAELAAPDGLLAGTGLAARALAREWGREFLEQYEGHAADPAKDGGFRTLRRLTSDALAAVLARYRLAGDPAAGTALWFARLARVRLFPEAPAVLARLAAAGLGPSLLSDADDDLLAPALTTYKLPLAHVFTSEGARAYKLDPQGRFFRHALSALGVAPEELLHVGDMAADFVGARQAGVRSVWLNRRGRPRPAHPAGAAPEHELPDLAGLPGLLGLGG